MSPSRDRVDDDEGALRSAGKLGDKAPDDPLLLKAAQTGEEAVIEAAAAQMERALRVEGWM